MANPYFISRAVRCAEELYRRNPAKKQQENDPKRQKTNRSVPAAGNPSKIRRPFPAQCKKTFKYFFVLPNKKLRNERDAGPIRNGCRIGKRGRPEAIGQGRLWQAQAGWLSIATGCRRSARLYVHEHI
jgi:hypothetical protein